jgi:hypothetical protein
MIHGKEAGSFCYKSNLRLRILYNIIFQEITLCLIGLLLIIDRHYYGAILIVAHNVLT